MPGCTDLSYEVSCAIANRLGFRGFESEAALSQIHSKRQFRLLCDQLDLPAPKLFSSIRQALALGGPLIVKPEDSHSGHGITHLPKPTEANLAAAWNNAKARSRKEAVIVEEFVQGDLFSYSAFLRNGRVETAFTVREFCFRDPFAVDTSYVVTQPLFQETRTR